MDGGSPATTRVPGRPRAVAIATLAARLVAAFLALGLAGCAGLSGSGGQAGESDTLRVMTYNIHHGADSQERMNVAEIAAVIRREQPDIVALQEVDRGVERTQRRDLLVELARLTGMGHRAFGKNIDHQGGQYGNAILSRHPIVRQTNTLLTQREPGERRGVLQAVVNVRGTQVAVLATHFDVRNDEERLLEVRQIEGQILPRYEDYPLVLAGDLNETPTGQVYRRLSARLLDAWSAGKGEGYTIPVDAPDRRIDYIFLSPHFAADSAWVPRTVASDHLPVVAVVRLAR